MNNNMTNPGARHKIYRIKKCPECGQVDRILRCGVCFECLKHRRGKAKTETIKRGEYSLLKMPANKSERQFIESAEEKGWTVIRKGWPDYFCFKLDSKGEIVDLMAVEVKPTLEEGLKLHQMISAVLLSNKTINCFLYGAKEKTLRKIEGKIPSVFNSRG